MRWRWSCGLCLVGTLSASEAHATEPAVGELDGKPIEAGTTVEVPAGTVKTLALSGGARVALLPGTTAIVSAPQWYPPEQGAKSIRGSRIFLKAGNVRVSLPAETAKPSALAVVGGGGQTMLLWRGTTRVGMTDGDMNVAVDEGAAYVGSEDRWLRMSAGAAALVAKKTAPQTFKGRLPAPEATPCTDGGIGIAYDNDKAPVRLCWKPVTGASAFRIELARDEAMNELVDTLDVPSGSALSGEPRVLPGRYFARVVALGAEHVPSLPSATKPLVVARVTLSQGAQFASEGAILMSKESAITLDTPGLMVASGGGQSVPTALANALVANAVTPTSKNFGLSGFRARVVRLRDASGAEMRLVFVLRELHARVEMTPRNARWPETPIDATVVLDDTSKRIDLSSEPVDLEVAVDGKIVPVTWARSADTFRARIAPIDGPGPFLVRVSAKDRTGAEIGSHIVDIDGRRPLDQVMKERKRNGAK